MSHRTGDLLGGRYRLGDRIAVGGMGEVWRATDTVLRRPIAVKTLRDDRATDPQFRKRFQHEARAMAALHHPGIADVYDFGQQPGDGTYLVMAEVGGEPLNERIARLGRLTAPDTMSIVAQVARALQAAHEAGIVHRDVKPGNVIVRPDGRAVLVDFGIARSAASPAITGAGEIVGTAHYIAPEQVRKQPVTPATDVYALGAVAYHCLAGHPPFAGDNPVAVAAQHVSQEPPPLPPDVPLPVRALVAAALANDPAARFPSAAAMARAAERAERSTEATTPTTLRLSTLPEPPGRPPARTRWRIVTILILVLLALSGVATVLAVTDPFGRSPAPPPATSVTRSRTAPTTPAPATTGNHSRRPSTSPATTTSKPAPTSTPPRSTPPTTTPPTTAPTTGSTTGPPTTQGQR